MAGHAKRMEQMRNAQIIFVRKPEGKRAHGRARCTGNDSITMVLSETG
jgi:hypothetical protein